MNQKKDSSNVSNMNQPQRQTAYKLWISTLLSGTYTKTLGEWEPNYLEVGDKKISRVNILAPVVEKYIKEDKTYASLTLDDSSGRITVKTWREDVFLLEHFEVGDLVLVLGKIKEYNGSFYVVPEIVKKLDNPLWAKHRTLELKNIYGEPLPAQPPLKEATISQETHSQEDTFSVIEEKVVNEQPLNFRKKIIDIIEQLDTNNGADQPTVINHTRIPREEAEKIIQTLIKEGEVFEIHPGKLRTTL